MNGKIWDSNERLGGIRDRGVFHLRKQDVIKGTSFPAVRLRDRPLEQPLQINGRATPRNDRYRNGFGGRYKDLLGCRRTLANVDAGWDRTFGADALEDELAGALA